MEKADKNRWPIYVISLPDALNRRVRIADQLSELGLNFCYFDAIDGRQGLLPEMETKIDRSATLKNLRRPMSDAEYACALSHMAIYQMILEAGLPGAIVLEDDAILGREFREFIQNEGYREGDLVLLDHADAFYWRWASWIGSYGGARLIRAARTGSLTTGYSCNKQAAFHIRKFGLPLQATADWPCDLSGISVLIAVPQMVGHPAFSTETSLIEVSRGPILAKYSRRIKRLRFFIPAYWKGKLMKTLMRKAK